MSQGNLGEYANKTFFLLLIFVSIFGFFGRIKSILNVSPFFDFNLYFIYADMAFQGVNPFDQNIDIRAGGILQAANYPPLFYFLMHPFTFLPFEKASTLWLMLNILFILVVAIMAFRIFQKNMSLFNMAVLVFIVGNFYPFIDTIYLGQANILVLLLLTAGLILILHNHILLSAVLIAISVHTKIQFVLIVPLLYIAGYQKLAKFACITIFFGWVVSIILVGWNQNIAYFKYLVAFPKELYLWVGNISLSSNIIRLFGYSEISVIMVSTMGLMFFCLVSIYLRKNKDKLTIQFVWVLSILVVLICTPLLEIHHLTLVFLPICYLIMVSKKEIDVDNGSLVVGMVSIFLLSIWVSPNPSPHESSFYLIPRLMVRTVGLFGLFWVLIKIGTVYQISGKQK